MRKREEKEMSNNCATREELLSLEGRITTRQDRLEDKMTELCKGQSRMSEKVVKIEATTENLKCSIDTLSTRLLEQKDAIIKEITLLALKEEGTALFKNKLQIEMGRGVIWFLGIAITALVGIYLTSI